MRTVILVSATLCALTAQPAWAQLSARTTVSFTSGVSSGEEHVGVALGGTVLVSITERVAVEANGTYLDRGSGADALNVGGSLVLNLASSRARGVPYVVVGGSVHHATFDLSDPRFMGNREVPFAPGAMVCAAPGPHAGTGPMPWWGAGQATCPANMAGYLGVGELPQFYGMRLGAIQVPASGRWDDRGFTDPALSFGGGLRFNLTERVVLRPDLRALVIFGGGDTHTIGLFVVNVGYRF